MTALTDFVFSLYDDAGAPKAGLAAAAVWTSYVEAISGGAATPPAITEVTGVPGTYSIPWVSVAGKRYIGTIDFGARANPRRIQYDSPYQGATIPSTAAAAVTSETVQSAMGLGSAQIDIVNRALAQLGIKKLLTTINDAGRVEADMARLFWAECVETLLQSFPWPFARRFATPLVQVVAAYDTTRWGFSYALPTDALAIRSIWTGGRTPRSDERVPFALELATFLTLGTVAKVAGSGGTTAQNILVTGLPVGDAGQAFVLTCDDHGVYTLTVDGVATALDAPLCEDGSSTVLSDGTTIAVLLKGADVDGDAYSWATTLHTAEEVLRCDLEPSSVSGSESPVAEYTARLSAAAAAVNFPPLFAKALSLVLAAELAMPLSVKGDLADRVQRNAALYLQTARAESRRGEQEDSAPDGALAAARG